LIAEPDTALVEVTSCPICGGQQLDTAFEEDGYHLLRCRQCGMGLVSPRRGEEDLAGIYIDDSYWRSQSPKTRGYHDYRADEPLYLETFRRRLKFALRGGPVGGTALDVGCAAGFCMQVLRERGFAVSGVEISETIARHAIDHFGFDTVHIGTLASAQFADASFDLITMWDVVEHVPDPEELLRTARKLLKPDGLLVIETQDIDSRFARLLGPRWHHFKHAEHIYHFNPATITTVVQHAGLRVEKMTHRYGGKYVSLHFIVERAGRLHPALSTVLRPLTKFESARLYLNFMDELVVLARPA
jgi:2-polyprenyl-3-methyl-5-hydroxy-6-metoxy-1,4-benzoquinol methylase